MKNEIIHGDCLAILQEMDDASVDAVVTDPPYGLKFMAKKWDDDCPDVGVWQECLRVLKPGGYLLAFSGTRTVDLVMGRIREAGFEIRDMLTWLYGQGFPKSHDISKAMDKALGAEREVVGKYSQTFRAEGSGQEGWQRPAHSEKGAITVASSAAAQEWDGWGTALKPACEPITMARKRIDKKTVAANMLAWRTGAINVDGCRIEGEAWKPHQATGLAKNKFFTDGEAAIIDKAPHDQGRWPANVLLDEEAAAMLGEESRFFYCAKASRAEREAGLEGFELQESDKFGDDEWGRRERNVAHARNAHPTVKPLSLMRWLCRLVTPPGGLIVDPFAGSGTTVIAAGLEGFSCIGIEKEEEYVRIAQARVKHWLENDMPLFKD